MGEDFSRGYDAGYRAGLLHAERQAKKRRTSKRRKAKLASSQAECRDALATAERNSELVNQLQAEVAELRAEVKEWLCEKCNFVYPGPPQAGWRCVICPKCGGSTAPRLTVESSRLQARLESAVGLLKVAKCPSCGEENGEPDGYIVDVDDYGKTIGTPCPWCATRAVIADGETG